MRTKTGIFFEMQDARNTCYLRSTLPDNVFIYLTLDFSKHERSKVFKTLKIKNQIKIRLNL